MRIEVRLGLRPARQRNCYSRSNQCGEGADKVFFGSSCSGLGLFMSACQLSFPTQCAGTQHRIHQDPPPQPKVVWISWM